MKKLIYATLLIASTAALSSFTMKNDSVAKHDTVSDKTILGTADDKTILGTADDKTILGTADAKKAANHSNDKTILGTAD
jgi:hypothetical protein